MCILSFVILLVWQWFSHGRCCGASLAQQKGCIPARGKGWAPPIPGQLLGILASSWPTEGLCPRKTERLVHAHFLACCSKQLCPSKVTFVG